MAISWLESGQTWRRIARFRGTCQEYFGTIFECRLVNSGDVALPDMPPPRFELVRPPATELSLMASGMMMPHLAPPEMAGSPQSHGSEGLDVAELRRKGVQHRGLDGKELPWYEWIFANPGEVLRMRLEPQRAST